MKINWDSVACGVIVLAAALFVVIVVASALR